MKQQSASRLTGSLIAFTVAAILGQSSIAAAQAHPGAKRFDISDQLLASALNEFARQSNRQILFSTDVVDAKRTRGVKGDLEPEAALRELLKGTGLTYRVTAGTILVERARERDTAAVTAAEKLIRLAQADHAAEDPGDPESEAAANRSSSFPPSADGPAVQLETIVVTGTHIRNSAPVGSPVAIYDRAYIEQTGVGSVEQFLRKIPQNFNLIDADTTQNNGNNPQANANAAFGSAVNLRGIGAGATLVLINGERIAPAGADGSFIDVSMIPLSAVERIEVLTDGASAIYGSDAVAGVVNFILRRNYDGAETALRYGGTSGGGALERSVSQLLGHSWDSGNVILTYEYFDQSGLDASRRDYIPDQGGPYLVLPEQERQSVFIAARQSLTPALDISATAFYSERSYLQDATSFGGLFRSRNTGTPQLYGATLGMELTRNDWNLSLVGNYSKTMQERTSEFSGLLESTVETPTRSEVQSFDARASGTIGRTHAGRIATSVGAGVRREEFSDLVVGGAGTGLRRTVTSLYGELVIPLASPEMQIPGMRKFDVSIAARMDDYSSIGSSTDPKVGFQWRIVDGLSLRGTYSRSFRAPLLADMSTAIVRYSQGEAENPDAPDGTTNTLFIFGGNEQLNPEKSKSYAVGLDIAPASLPGFTASLTYFSTEYRDRIATPPVVGSILSIYHQADALAPFIDLSPDPARVHDIFANNFVLDSSGLGEAGVEAIFDSRSQNLASTRTSGIEFSFSLALQNDRVGAVDLFLAGDYLLEMSNRAAETVPPVDLLNRIFNPMDFRFRSGATWKKNAVTASASINYASGYENNLVSPAERVSSWTTVDAVIGYDTPERFGGVLGDLRVMLSAQNLFDREPPPVTIPANLLPVNLGYDATNASPRGRVLAIQIEKKW